jgi:SnoaL-like domain
MEEQAIRAALERHWANVADHDQAHELYHEEVVLEFPQGGERLVGLRNVRAMREAYPAKVEFRTERIRGRGDLWVVENVITYDGATSMRTVNILEFRAGKVIRETIYFGEPWEPPAWRAPWVERLT